MSEPTEPRIAAHDKSRPAEPGATDPGAADPGAAEPAGPAPDEPLLAESPAAEAVLRRLHPLSSVLRGWKLFAALSAYTIAEGLPELLAGDFGRGRASPWLAAGILPVALVVAALYGVLSWLFTRYGLDGGDLRIDTGVLFRRSRRVRLDRLQAVDVVRPVLARMLGLAELRLEVAGGSSTEAPLAYLSVPDAQRLRAELLARAAGLAETTPEAPERLLYVVPDGRLFVATLLQLPVVIGLLFGVASAASTITDARVGAVVTIPAIGSALLSIIRQFAPNQGFTLAESPDGLRIRRGLLETRAQTVPPGRIQAVRVVEPLLWRLAMGWARVEVEVAGYAAAGAAGAASAVLLPVAPRADCLALLGRVLPEADVTSIPTTGVPRRARWLDPISGGVLAAGADDRYFLTRRGALRRETDVMPHERVQSVRAHQGPLQRLLGLASVTLDTTPGPITVTAEHRAADDALRMAEQQARLARTARAQSVGDQWMAGYDDAGGSR